MKSDAKKDMDAKKYTFLLAKIIKFERRVKIIREKIVDDRASQRRSGKSYRMNSTKMRRGG